MARSVSSSLQQKMVGIAKLRFVVIVLLAAITIAGDAWNLLPPGAIMQRWTLLGILLGCNGVAYYACRTLQNTAWLRLTLYLQLALDIALATFLVYSERGIASKSVLLYTLPIISAGVLIRRSALYATAVVAIASYVVATLRYQFLHPGEAYKVELYSTMALYSGLLLLLAALLTRVMGLENKK